MEWSNASQRYATGWDNDDDGEVDEGFDVDGDTFADCLDNCPDISNMNQSDGDGDDVGDVCDNCLVDPNSSQLAQTRKTENRVRIFRSPMLKALNSMAPSASPLFLLLSEGSSKFSLVQAPPPLTLNSQRLFRIR